MFSLSSEQQQVNQPAVNVVAHVAAVMLFSFVPSVVLFRRGRNFRIIVKVSFVFMLIVLVSVDNFYRTDPVTIVIVGCRLVGYGNNVRC